MKNKTACATCVLLLVVLLSPVAAAPAFADGGVHCTGIWAGGAGADDVSPAPHSAYIVSVEFDKNVSYANNGRDDAFVWANAEKIHLRRAWDGAEVEGATVQPGGSEGERRLFYIANGDWLLPLTAYEVVIEPGIMAANGQDVSDREYIAVFKTSALCPNGVSLCHNVGIPLVAALLVAGAVVQVRRVRRQRA